VLKEKRWEVGSEFDWSNDTVTSSLSKTFFPETHKLFSTGRSILLSLPPLFKRHQSRLRLHLPSFFCMDVAADLSKVFELCWYRDMPTELLPDFNSLNPLPGDLVLSVNLFGIKEGKVWQDWASQHKDIILIEDHTHDPISPWAQQSTAHYAMASVRKTLPIPDGAIIWSPQKLQLPQPALGEPSGAYKKLIAMLLKRAYLSGANISKDAYRMFQIEGEQALNAETSSAASSFTSNILNYLNISELRKKRELNIKQFFYLLLTETHSNCKPLFTTWSSGAVPFNSILVCANNEVREGLRKFLISQNIFATVHWQQPFKGFSANDSMAIDLSNRILTIPTDQRYSLDDIERIVSNITEFLKTYDHIAAT
jgi:hypothetical protein